jgi:integrator complex subunit 6
VSAVDHEVLIPENFPFDKFEIDSNNALCQYLLMHKPNACWHVYVQGSMGNPQHLGEPFGFIKASKSQNTVHLFLLPYQFPKLWPLIGLIFSPCFFTPSQYHRYLCLCL